MKYIFDFDDVLFNNTKQFKVHMFSQIAQAGVPMEDARNYYIEVREKEFSLKDFIAELFSRYGICESKIEQVYQNIMQESPNFLNTILIEKVKELGKENCFIVTNGDQVFNTDKVTYSGVKNLFEKVYIVPGTKREVIYEICEKYKDEKVFFTDDKIKFFDDIDLTRCPNLQTILYSI